MSSSQPPSGFHLGYRPALDGLRAIAILVVMIYHAQIPAFRGGFLGVDLFFVLSGFLITTILVQEIQHTGRIDFWHFYKRRFLRLSPALAFLLVIYVAVSVINSDVLQYTLLQSAIVLAYSANWVLALDILSMNLMSHTWSLAIEEQFYIVFPLLLRFMVPRLRWERLRLWLLLGIGVVFVWRLVLWGSGAEWYRLYYGTDTRADALLWGCWLGVTLSTSTTWQSSFWRRWASKGTLPAIGVLILFITMARVGDIQHYSWTFPVTALIGTILVFHLVTAPRGSLHQLLEMPFMVGVGKISYGLYLWHHPIFKILLSMGMSELHVLLLGTPLTFAFAGFSYYFVERPFLRRNPRSEITPIDLPRSNLPQSTGVP